MSKKLGLIGGGFQHAYSSTWWKRPSAFEWNMGKYEDITCFVDDAIVANINTPNFSGKKIAWVLESSAIIGNIVEDVIRHHKEISDAYEFVISHDKRITSLAPNFYYLPPHGYWIESPQPYTKSKLCSMITSNKRMCAGHEYRLMWKDRLFGKVDLYGSGFNPFAKKEEALVDYMFSVTIENAQYETYWSEKILDCFASATIPIYHGSPDIGEYFNMDGIILLTDEFDVNYLSEDLYRSKKSAILDNLNRVMKYDVIEDIMWEMYISKIL